MPTSREATYKAKQAVDSIVVRAADVIRAGVVWVGSAASFGVPAFAAVNAVLTLGWLYVVSRLNKEHARLTSFAN